MLDQSEIYPYRREGKIRSQVFAESKLGRIGRFSFSNIDLSKLFQWSDIPWYLVAFLLGRAAFLEILLPFVLPALGVTYLFSKRRFLGVFVAIGLGALSLFAGVKFLGVFLTMVLFSGLLYVIKLQNPVASYALPLLAFSITIISKSLVAFLTMPSLYLYLVNSIEAVLAGALSFIFWRGASLFQTAGDRRPSYDQIFGLALVSAGALVGLKGLSFNEIALIGVLSRYAILLSVFVGGIGTGTIAGTILGLIPSLTNLNYSPMMAGIYAFSGLMSGAFLPFGRVGVVIGMALSNIFLSIYLGDQQAVTTVFLECLIAILLFMGTPLVLLEGFKNNLGFRSNEVSFELKRQTSKKVQDFAMVFQELAKTFGEIACEHEVIDRERYEEVLLGRLCQQICPGCPRFSRCWRLGSEQTNEKLKDLLYVLDQKADYVDLQRVRLDCLREKEMLVALKCFITSRGLNQYWQGKLVESRNLISNQFQEVSSLMEGLAKEIESKPDKGEDFGLDCEECPLTAEIGVAKAAKDGTVVSGDNYVTLKIKESKYAILLSDGMGVGPKAAAESKATVTLLSQLLTTGFDERMAVKTVNSALMMRSREDTFATVDLALLNLENGQADFIKIGAAPSLLKRGDKIGVIRSTSLPIGILDQMEADTVRQCLQHGDIIVMFTDGLLDFHRGREDKEEWVVQVLANCRTEDPQNIADYLLNKARLEAGNTIPDDMTVIAIRIQEKGSNTYIQ